MRTPKLYLGSEGDYLSRWKRIIHIDARLRSGELPSATALARECGVSVKTIYRDLEALKDELSAPVVYDARRKGFRYSESGFAIPATALSERDLFALMVAENALAQYAGTPIASELRAAFDKILAVLPGETRAQHELSARALHFSGMPPAVVPADLWATLTAAIRAREKLDLDYCAAGRRTRETRRVDPYLLVVRDREWFLLARTQRQRNYALFFLPRIRAATRTGQSYEVDPQFSAERYYEHGFNAMHGAGEPELVRLRFPPEHAHIAEERPWAARQKLVRKRDGSAHVEFRSNALFEVERTVLRFGGVVEVLGPARLRAAVREASARLTELHRGEKR